MTYSDLFQHVTHLYGYTQRKKRRSNGFIEMGNSYVPYDHDNWIPVLNTPFPGGVMKGIVSKGEFKLSETKGKEELLATGRTLVLLQDWGEYERYYENWKSKTKDTGEESLNYYKRTRTELIEMLSSEETPDARQVYSKAVKDSYMEFYTELQRNRVVYLSNFWMGLRVEGRSGPVPYRNDASHREVSRLFYQYWIREMKPALILYYGEGVYKACQKARLTKEDYDGISRFVVDRRDPSQFRRIP